MRAFPPRLPEQPIFSPVTSEAYAAKIARDWNVAADGATAAEGLDVYYLQQLSPDAVPAVDGLEGPLRTCLLASVAVTPPTGFADWNLGRARAC